jgi:hypothetical protein
MKNLLNVVLVCVALRVRCVCGVVWCGVVWFGVAKSMCGVVWWSNLDFFGHSTFF